MLTCDYCIVGLCCVTLYIALLSAFLLFFRGADYNDDDRDM